MKLEIESQPGMLEKYDYEYVRCGVCNIFMANEPLAESGLPMLPREKQNLTGQCL